MGRQPECRWKVRSINLHVRVLVSVTCKGSGSDLNEPVTRRKKFGLFSSPIFCQNLGRKLTMNSMSHQFLVSYIEETLARNERV